MRLKLIACKSIARELSYLCAKSQNNIDITFLRQGNHNNPDLLRKVLQDEINSIETGNDYHTNEVINVNPSPYNGDFDAVLIGYGLCSNGIMDISSEKYKLIIPKAHDCITFLLGSKEKYTDYFNNMPGAYWYSMSWIESGFAPSGNLVETERENEIRYYKEKGYDDEDIEYMLEIGSSWIKNYKTAAYIQMPFFDKEEYRDYTKKAAESFKWEYKSIDGDMTLMEDFVNGNWDNERFLIVPPKNKIVPSYDDEIIKFTENLKV